MDILTWLSDHIKDLIQLVNAIAALVAAIATLGNRKRTEQAITNAEIKTTAEIQNVHGLVNSKMTELVEAERGRSRAEGHQQGQDDERARQSKTEQTDGKPGVIVMQKEVE